MLISAIVGSTDAAVFSLLHSHGMELKRRVAATLEIESGSNDPMAIFLTVALVDLLARGGAPSWSLAWLFVQQMGLGVLLGLAGGRALAWFVNRLPLAPASIRCWRWPAACSSSLTAMLRGSGFLAIYVAGLVLGNQRLHSANNILRVHDGIAWLGQIAMFLVLGLLVTPSELIKLAPAALAIALVLMLSHGRWRCGCRCCRFAFRAARRCSSRGSACAVRCRSCLRCFRSWRDWRARASTSMSLSLSCWCR
jgi:cell volume regulation protein A